MTSLKISRLGIILACALALALLLCAFASADEKDSEAPLPTLHVRAGGTGTGKSSSDPMGDMFTALEALSERGGRITVYGKYELSSSEGNDGIWGAFVEPAHTGKVVISGVDAYLICPENYRYYLSGPTEFENIGISGSGALLVAARFNPLIMGDGINIIGFSDGVQLIGGFNGSNSGLKESDLSRDSYIEVRSGTYKYICAYNRGTSEKNCTGEGVIKVYGGQINCIAAGISNGNALFTSNKMASLSVTVAGGSVFKLCDTDMKGYGALSALSLSYEGGEIKHVIIPGEADTSIVYTEDMKKSAEGILRHFDSCGMAGGDMSARKTIKIACVGDSTTSGAGLAFPAKESYPAQLGLLLGDAYEVRNFAEGGRTVRTDTGRAYIDSESFSESCGYQPDAVLIMLGTNDLASVSGEEGAAALYRDILALCESYSKLESAPVIYLLTPLVRLDDGALDDVIVNIVCPAYKKAAEDAGVGYVDTHAISEDVTGHFPDSLHPDASACSYIATYLYGAVVSNKSLGSLYTQGDAHEIIIKNETVILPPDTDEDQTEDSGRDTEHVCTQSAQSADTQGADKPSADVQNRDGGNVEILAVVLTTVVFCSALAVLILFSKKKLSHSTDGGKTDEENNAD